MIPRVVLADDHLLIAEALKTVLAPDYQVLRVVEDGRTLVDAALELKPDLVVADIFMPLLNGLDAAAMIRAELPDMKFVFLTMNLDPDLAAKAFRIGASGYLLKNSAGNELAACLRAVCSGETYMTPLLAGGDVGDLLLQSGPGQSALSPREREVLQLLAEGKSMKQVAAVLDISPRTVQFHKYRIMARFHLNSGAELVQFALKQHIV